MRRVVESFGILMREIPLLRELVFSLKPMMMVVEDGHRQMFNPNLGGVVRILNLGNDFRGLHKIV